MSSVIVWLEGQVYLQTTNSYVTDFGPTNEVERLYNCGTIREIAYACSLDTSFALSESWCFGELYRPNSKYCRLVVQRRDLGVFYSIHSTFLILIINI